jgi:hypothetical protein
MSDGCEGRLRPGGLPRQRLRCSSGRLALGKRQQAEHGDPAGQRLGDLRGQEQILRPRQKVLAVRGPALVDPFLDIGQQFGCVLNLVENDWRRVHLEEASGIGDGRSAHVWRFQGNVARRFAEQVVEQGGLPRLARAGQHDRGKLSGSLAELSRSKASCWRLLRCAAAIP